MCARHQGRRGCVEFIGAVNDGKPELVRASLPSQSASKATALTANTFTKDNRDFEGCSGVDVPSV